MGVHMKALSQINMLLVVLEPFNNCCSFLTNPKFDRWIYVGITDCQLSAYFSQPESHRHIICDMARVIARIAELLSVCLLLQLASVHHILLSMK
jgi:hypothetical protein